MLDTLIVTKRIVVITCFLLVGEHANVIAQTTQATEVKFCYEEQELTPYFMGSSRFPATESPGVLIEMLYRLDEQFPGLKFTFYRAPWKRCLSDVSLNNAHAIVSSYSQERASVAVFPIEDGQVISQYAISVSKYCLFTMRDSKLRWDGKAFSRQPQKPIAVPQGYSIVSMLNEHEQPLVYTNSSISAMELLTKNRAEAAVTFCDSGAQFLWRQDDPSLGIIAQSPALSLRRGYLAFNKPFYQVHQDKVEQLWKQIALIRNREFHHLLEKYDLLALGDQLETR